MTETAKEIMEGLMRDIAERTLLTEERTEEQESYGMLTTMIIAPNLSRQTGEPGTQDQKTEDIKVDVKALTQKLKKLKLLLKPPMLTLLILSKHGCKSHRLMSS